MQFSSLFAVALSSFMLASLVLAAPAAAPVPLPESEAEFTPVPVVFPRDSTTPNLGKRAGEEEIYLVNCSGGNPAQYTSHISWYASGWSNSQRFPSNAMRISPIGFTPAQGWFQWEGKYGTYVNYPDGNRVTLYNLDFVKAGEWAGSIRNNFRFFNCWGGGNAYLYDSDGMKCAAVYKCN